MYSAIKDETARWFSQIKLILSWSVWQGKDYCAVSGNCLAVDDSDQGVFAIFEDEIKISIIYFFLDLIEYSFIGTIFENKHQIYIGMVIDDLMIDIVIGEVINIDL